MDTRGLVWAVDIDVGILNMLVGWECGRLLDRENWAQRKWPSWETRKIFCRTKSLLVSGLKTLHTGVFVF